MGMEPEWDWRGCMMVVGDIDRVVDFRFGVVVFSFLFVTD